MSPPTSAQLASKEGRMALAINSYKSGSFTSIREAANTYGVPESTLRTRLQRRPSRQEIRSANLKLTDTEEQTLIDWDLIYRRTRLTGPYSFDSRYGEPTSSETDRYGRVFYAYGWSLMAI
jgi:hypothetical protein